MSEHANLLKASGSRGDARGVGLASSVAPGGGGAANGRLGPSRPKAAAALPGRKEYISSPCRCQRAAESRSHCNRARGVRL